MLSEDMHDKLRALAENLGQTPATLASMAVSQYVYQQTAAAGAAERAIGSVFEKLVPHLQEMMGGILEAPKPATRSKKPKVVQMRIEDAT